MYYRGYGVIGCIDANCHCIFSIRYSHKVGVLVSRVIGCIDENNHVL